MQYKFSTCLVIHLQLNSAFFLDLGSGVKLEQRLRMTSNGELKLDFLLKVELEDVPSLLLVERNSLQLLIAIHK